LKNQQFDPASTNPTSTDPERDKPHAQKSPRKRPSRRKSRSHSQSKSKTQQLWNIEQFQVPEAEGKMRFHDLNLSDEIMHAIYDLGFEYCSPIQAQILPHTLKGLDAIGKAQTGTGKTAAYLITIIDDLLRNPIPDSEERFYGDPRALIIAPTRELVMWWPCTAARNIKSNINKCRAALWILWWPPREDLLIS
jgi:ATP-dependent RNA helicase RhlB